MVIGIAGERMSESQGKAESSQNAERKVWGKTTNRLKHMEDEMRNCSIHLQ